MILLSCYYRSQEFVRVGYYLSISCNTPCKQYSQIERIIYSDKPRITYFPITWCFVCFQNVNLVLFVEKFFLSPHFMFTPPFLSLVKQLIFLFLFLSLLFYFIFMQPLRYEQATKSISPTAVHPLTPFPFLSNNSNKHSAAHIPVL